MNQQSILAALGCAMVLGTTSCSMSRPPTDITGLTPKVAKGDRLAPGHAVEPHIADLIERTLSRLPRTTEDRWAAARNLGKGGKQGRKKGASTPARANVSPVVAEVTSDRGETLRVAGPGGDLCAAISISPQLAVTALHCVRDLCATAFAPPEASVQGCKIGFELPQGPSGEATVVSTSENDLLALLELSQPLLKSGSLFCDNPRAKDKVYTVSHPLGHNWMVSYGWLTRDPIALEWVGGQATRVLVAEIPTKPGSSGGGLFDSHDRVVGVQIARWSAWTSDFGKAAFIQSSRIFNLAGNYCMKQGSSACLGLRCTSANFDIWQFDQKNLKSPSTLVPYARAPYLSM